jgi:hypothetical protein
VAFDRDLTDLSAVESLRCRLNAKYPHRLSTMDLTSLLAALGAWNQILLVGNFSQVEAKSSAEIIA